MDELIVEMVMVNGVEGPSLYLDDYRICGNKPWGGGNVVRAWKIDLFSLKKTVEEKIASNLKSPVTNEAGENEKQWLAQSRQSSEDK